MGVMVGSVAWRAALILGVALGVVAVVLGAALPRDFFEDFGWAAGPGAWAACALLAGALLRLALLPVLVGAALAGLPGVAGVLVGVHWLGPPIGVVLFGLWCGRLSAGPRGSEPVAA